MQVSHSCSDDGMGLCLYVQGLEWLWMTKGENQQWIRFASEIWNLEFVIATNSWKVLNLGMWSS